MPPRGCERQFNRSSRILSTTLHCSAATLGLVGILAFATVAQGGERIHTIPFFPSMSDTFLDGIARVINHSGEAGEIRINAFDDEGESYGPLVLSIAAAATVHLTSDDLETGSTAIGLSGSLPPGQGDWRLQLSSELEIEVLAYVGTADGFLTAMHDTVPGEGMGRRVAIFNPSNDDGQVSSLRLINPGDEAAEVSIVGIDDDGASPGSEVKTTIPAGASRMLTASVLEAGGEGLEGSLGDGAGMWQLIVESAQPIVAMNLLSAPTGHLTNLSTSPPNGTDNVHLVPLLPTASDALGRQGFVRVINLSDVAGQVTIQAFDGTSWEFEALTLSLPANQAVQFDSDDLEYGNADKRLSEGTGAGQGDWRLELTSRLDIRVLSYVRAADGVVEAMHDVVSVRDRQYRVATFNPGNDGEPQSLLWLANPGDDAADVTVTGIDDTGESPGTEVHVTVPSGESTTLTVKALEAGGDGLEGALGDGEGRWRLTVESVHPIIVMSLLSDPTGHLANLSTAPGLGAGSESRGNPDVMAESPAVSDSAPLAGAQFNLSATARNGGDTTSMATTLRYYRSTNRTISSSDAQVGTDDVEALAASGSSAESVALTAPPTAGTYYYGVCVDAVEEESETRNNCSRSVQVTVSTQADEPGTEGQPNLVAGSPSVSDSGPAAGTRFALSATVRNDGDGPSAATTLRYYRSTNATISAFDTAAGTVALVPLAASGSVGDSVDVTAPSTAGTYYLGACVDAVAGESDTADNCSTAVQVDVQEASSQGKPDLTVSPVWVATGSSTTPPGGSFTLLATVRNDGDGASEATTLRYFRSVNAMVTTSDAASGTADLAELAASESSGESMELTAPSTPGTYYYGACVDSMADESDTMNNCSAAVRVDVQEPEPEPETQSGPDLAVGSPTVSDSSPETGSTFTLSATVGNAGSGESATTTLRYFRSTDATISSSDTQVGTDAVSALEASGSSAQSVTLTAPASGGTYYFGACVDSVDDESDTTDNCSSSVGVNVLESQQQSQGTPDLEAGSPTVSDSSPETGARFTLSATVSNTGDGESAATTLRYYRSTDSTITTADTALGTDAVGALAPAGTSSESVSLAAPSAPGTYYYGACVDAVEDESDTSNNCSAAAALTVEARPDLAVSATLRDTVVGPGARFTLSATVSNTGDGESAATTLRYYRSTDSTITTADTALGTDAVGALAPAGASSESVSLAARSAPGTYYYGACVDAVEDESDTSNNCSAAAALTVEARPDLKMSAWLRDTVVGTGARFMLLATVSNTGDGESAATTLRHYRSTDSTITTADTALGTDPVGALPPAGVSSNAEWFLAAPSAPGTYYYGACVDAVEDESDTSNNCSAAAALTVEARPDLKVSASLDHPVVIPGASFRLSATVSNTGDGESATTTLRYYRSTDSTITTADTALGTDAVGALAPAGARSESVSLAAPAAPGTYYYGTCVDAVEDESDTSNNCSAAADLTVGPRPDLKVLASLDHPVVNPGASIKLWASVANTGDRESAATTVRFYRSTDSTITTADTALGTDPVGALPPFLINFNWERQWVSLDAPSAPGTYYYGACVDAVEDEADTSNNCDAAELTVDARPVDLEMSARLEQSVVGPSEPVRLIAKMRNLGGTDASETTVVRYYQSLDATITPSDDELGRTQEILAYALSTLEPSLHFPAPSQLGTYYYGACADALEDESDTSNNCSAAVELTVKSLEPLPDYLTVSATLSPTLVAPGEEVLMTVEVDNPTDGHSPAINLRFYRSVDATITRSDRELHTVPSISILAGLTQPFLHSSTAPQEAGTYYYGACFEFVVDYTETSNNCSAAAELAVGLGSDLSVFGTKLTFDLESPRLGGPIRMFAQVRNRGGESAAATTLRYYRSADARFTDSDTQVATVEVGALGAGDRTGHWVDLTAPSIPGTYFYGACVDSVLNESNRSNNCSLANRIAVPLPRPDLVVSTPRVNDASQATGATFTLTVSVTNVGDWPAAADATLRYYQSTDAEISGLDTEVGTDEVEPPGTSAEGISLTAPSTPGTYFYGACVDSVSGESNTTNNCSGSVQVDVE